ncbi:DEAD/DEAH box helicase [Myxococcota bacterium]|nr:DEAD/DEAH box helicase [Myxococcota bacterium]
MSTSPYSPGSLVTARGREWIVLSGSDDEFLRLRPVAGSEEDECHLHVGLELEPVRDARFPLPAPEPRASHDAALLLRDALLLSLRRGAGPFRSFGQIAVEPRAYQLVPLLMALKLDPVRLLVADDVGVGKTIEAALIAREYLDRGEVARTAVLCPPHLVDQWTAELRSRFHIRATAVTAASAGRLERELRPSESIFDAHPHTVVSLDYIKSDRRRDSFLHHCPEFVIVDEAHTCASTTSGRHQRYDLLRGLCADEGRHLVLLTATPHSGDDAAYYRLLDLLDPEFGRLGELQDEERKKVRERLGAHFVQRRRPDIEEWQDGTRIFPRRETKEITYQLTGEWDAFIRAVLDYCASVVQSAEGDERRQRLNFWGTLALLRCASSSPAAAVLALGTRAGLEVEDREGLLDQLFDGEPDALAQDDLEPEAGIADPELAGLVERARRLAGAKGDPKLKKLTDHVVELTQDGFNPVVFCRYIATAHYLHRHLTAALEGVRVALVTGEDPAELRKEAVESLAGEDRCVLVATDCLSEGVNLQETFDAVVHYDLSWNPTRHEQREGRVDRFGQSSPVVRATLLYGANNPVDGAVLHVILRKAEAIRRELGVPVPLPDSGHALSQALMKAVLLRERKAPLQTSFDFMALQASKALDSAWRDAAEKAKQNRTIFAQRRLRPADVLPEWHRTLAAIGGQDDVHRFVDRALARLGSALEPMKKGWKAPLGPLPAELRERLEHAGLQGTLSLDFAHPPRGRCRTVNRSHPLVSVLAESLLERTLASTPEGAGDPSVLGRAGCWVTSAVATRTTVALLRVRHRLTTVRGPRRTDLVVEEAAALAWSGADPAVTAEGEEALRLLLLAPEGDPPPHVQARVIDQALALVAARSRDLDALAEGRALALEADHARVRESARDRGRHAVEALLPPDVIGLYVLLPRVA